MTTTCPNCGGALERRGNLAYCTECDWASDPVAQWVLFVISVIAVALLAWGGICALRALGLM